MAVHDYSSKTLRTVGLNPSWAPEKDHVWKQQFWIKLTCKALHLKNLGYFKLCSRHTCMWNGVRFVDWIIIYRILQICNCLVGRVRVTSSTDQFFILKFKPKFVHHWYPDTCPGNVSGTLNQLTIKKQTLIFLNDLWCQYKSILF